MMGQKINFWSQPEPPKDRRRIAAYLPNWGGYGKKYFPKNIPIDYVDDIIYAFVKLGPAADNPAHIIPVISDPWLDTDKHFTNPAEGVEPLDTWTEPQNHYFGFFNQLKKLQAIKPTMRVLMSIGGWTFSKHFSDAFATEDSRNAFADATIAFIKKYDIFSGIDFDWEYISPANQNWGAAGNSSRADDGPNFVAFLDLFRKKLAAAGMPNLRLTAAISADPKKIKILPLETMHPLLDAIKIMTIDFATSKWGPTPASHAANLKSNPAYTANSIEGSVDTVMARGVPADKIMIGIPFYSRGFANTDGLGKPSNGCTSNKGVEDGVSDVCDMPLAGHTEAWDESTQSSYCYDATTKEMHSYETIKSLEAKVAYVKAKGLQGIYVWDITGDFRDTNNPRCLIKALATAMKN